LISFYLIFYGIARFFIEGMRTDSLYIGDFRVSQLVSIGIVIFGLAIRFIAKSRQKNK
ncbi:MAG: prolipoprotein diacylglyceryl transferase, partial [Peptoniphilus harei]|nr:prolipoprotein diacylglyceryl transferase [Peptoniphilus harei]